jgi:hypothetical protein
MKMGYSFQIRLKITSGKGAVQIGEPVLNPGGCHPALLIFVL